MAGLAIGLAAGISGLVACYAIAFVITRATAPLDADDFAHGDVIEIPKVSHPQGHTP